MRAIKVLKWKSMRIPSKCLRACLRARVVISTHLVLGGRRLSLPLASQNRQKNNEQPNKLTRKHSNLWQPDFKSKRKFGKTLISSEVPHVLPDSLTTTFTIKQTRHRKYKFKVLGHIIMDLKRNIYCVAFLIDGRVARSVATEIL